MILQSLLKCEKMFRPSMKNLDLKMIWTFFDWLSFLAQQQHQLPRRMFDSDQLKYYWKDYNANIETRTFFNLIRIFWVGRHLSVCFCLLPCLPPFEPSFVSIASQKTSKTSHKRFLRRFSLPLNTENSNSSILQRQKRRFWGFWLNENFLHNIQVASLDDPAYSKSKIA